MRKSRIFKGKVVRPKGFDLQDKLESKEIVEICENCPFPDCIDSWGKGCDYYRKKVEELSGKKEWKKKKEQK